MMEKNAKIYVAVTNSWYDPEKEEQKSNINFLHVKPVYTIVIMEKSAGNGKVFERKPGLPICV